MKSGFSFKSSTLYLHSGIIERLKPFEWYRNLADLLYKYYYIIKSGIPNHLSVNLTYVPYVKIFPLLCVKCVLYYLCFIIFSPILTYFILQGIKLSLPIFYHEQDYCITLIACESQLRLPNGNKIKAKETEVFFSSNLKDCRSLVSNNNKKSVLQAKPSKWIWIDLHFLFSCKVESTPANP